MEALNNILNRVSARELSSPYPNTDEMELIYKAALRAPDHAWLRPSTFIEVKDEALDKLSKIFVKYGESLPDISDEVLKLNEIEDCIAIEGFCALHVINDIPKYVVSFGNDSNSYKVSYKDNEIVHDTVPKTERIKL